MRANEDTSGLILNSVCLRLEGVPLISIDCRIRSGQILTIMGESGSGKSSLLDFIAGFLKPAFQAEGKLLLNGEDLTDRPAQKRHIGLMFQSPLLFPHMSVLQNLMFALPPSIAARGLRKEAALKALEDVGLAGFAGRDPATLSGGQQTRVALMRTLLADPKALLLDEPFSSLDQTRRADVRELVFRLAREKNLPVLLVTHDQEDAVAAGGMIHYLDGRDPGTGCSGATHVKPVSAQR